jgi:hypothetical protein
MFAMHPDGEFIFNAVGFSGIARTGGAVTDVQFTSFNGFV